MRNDRFLVVCHHSRRAPDGGSRHARPLTASTFCGDTRNEQRGVRSYRRCPPRRPPRRNLPRQSHPSSPRRRPPRSSSNTTGQAAKGAAMAEAATVGVKLNFERPAANEPSNKDSRSPLRTLLPSAPPTEPKSASGASRRVDAEGGPSEETSTRDPPVAATAEGSPVSASVGDAHFMTPAHALRGPQDEDATPGDTPATVRVEHRPLNRGTPHRSVTAFQKSRPESICPVPLPGGRSAHPSTSLNPSPDAISHPSPITPSGDRPPGRPRAPERRPNRRRRRIQG